MPGDPLYGRVTELEVAARDLDAAARGARSLLLIEGEAGIGKTRLLSEVSARAQAEGFTLLEGRASELEREVPLLPLLDAIEPHLAAVDPGRLAPARMALLAGVFPGFASGSSEEGSGVERWRLYRALADLLGLIAGERPLLLLIDDVHWADPTTEELLAHLIRRPPCDSLLIAIGSRPGRAADRLRGAQRSSGTTGLSDLRLRPLTRADADPLLAAVAEDGRRERLFAASGGNPLLLGELVRGGGAELPGGILVSVGAEVDGLDDEARGLLEAAAVLGDPFDLDLAAAVAGLDGSATAAALDQLTGSRLVRASGRPRHFSFRHPVFRTAVNDRLGDGARLVLHAAAAAELERTGAALPVRARHLAQTASPGDRVAAATLGAAASAVRPRAPDVAAEWLLAARRAAPDEIEPSVLIATLVEAGRLVEALDAIEDIGGAGAPEAAVAGAAIERLLGRHDAAEQRLLRAYAAVDAGTPAAARLAVDLAVAAYQRGEYAQTDEWARQVGAHGAVGAVGAVAAILRAVGSVSVGEVDAGGKEVGAALEALARADDEELVELAEPAMAVSWGLLALDQLVEGLAMAERIADAAARGGNPLAAIPHRFAAVLALGLLGRFRDAEPLADEAEQAARVSGVLPLLQWALWLRGWVLLERGELDQAFDAARESVELAEEMDDSASVVVARAVLGAVLGARGEHDRARRLLAAYDIDNGWICRWAPFLVESDLAAGDLGAAREHARRAATLAPRTGMAGARAASARADALVALADEQSEVAADLALRAVEEAVAAGLMLEAARAQLVAGRALVGTDRDAAIAQLTAAARGAAECGARRVADEAHRELRRAGVRLGRGGPRAPGEKGLASLSPRELETARLVSEGLTNREIAARLFLSEKTIETHLTHVFQKLGLRSRTQVAALIASSG